MSNILKEKLQAAIDAKNNNVNNFIWKFARNSDGTQDEIRLIDATPEQLQRFYTHCYSMLYNVDKLNPGRYKLLEIIKEQRVKCNIELFLRALENGSAVADHRPYARYLYLQDLRAILDRNKSEFEGQNLKEIRISSLAGELPREFERLSIDDVLTGCLDGLGLLDVKHLTFSFILSLGIFFTQDELKEFNKVEKDKDGNEKPVSKMLQIKEKLGMNPSVRLTVKPDGLRFNEFRAMVNLRPKKYSELTSDQLTVLRDKVLFRLEDEVKKHIESWETKLNEIRRVARLKNVELTDDER